MFLPTANIENMKYSAFTPLVFNFAWAARLHHPANFPTHAKRNRYEQRHRWTLDGIEFAASAITLRLRSGQVRPPRNDTRHTGFTLVELLVVIVVILSITAMMLPAIHNARNSAKATACSANLARLLSAMAAYESMDESFPYGFDRRPTDPPPGGPVGGSDDRMGWWWFNYIDVYSGGSPYKPSVVKCPAKRLAYRRRQLNILSGNYGANLSICREADLIKTEFKGTPLSRSDVRSPSQTMLLADSGYATIKWWHATPNPPVSLNKKKIEDTGAYIPGLSINSQRLSQKLIFPGQESDAIDGRHPGKTVNAGFVDGHVERTRAEDLLVDSKGEPSGDADIRWKTN